MNKQPMIPTRAAVLALAAASSLAVALGGCASTPAPSEQMAVAEAAVQHANTSSTSESAAGELQVATDKLASARQVSCSDSSLR